MLGMGEHVNRFDRVNVIVMSAQLRQVAQLGLGVAAHVHDALGQESSDAREKLWSRPCARWIHDHDVVVPPAVFSAACAQVGRRIGAYEGAGGAQPVGLRVSSRTAYGSVNLLDAYVS